MNRLDFLKLSGIGLAGIIIAPQIVFESELPTHSKADGLGFGFHGLVLLCRSLI